jgi:hypothetical protein
MSLARLEEVDRVLKRTFRSLVDEMPAPPTLERRRDADGQLWFRSSWWPAGEWHPVLESGDQRAR